MKKTLLGNYLTAIDIGTTKICVLIATVDPKNGVQVVGIGQTPSYGLKKGVVVNISKTVESIKIATQQASEMAGVPVETAVVGISGGHIKSYNSTGVVAIKRRDVSQEDINRVIDAAKAIPIPQDQDILHVLPQYFRVDGQEYVLDSLGMYGVRLEAQVHIITGAVASAQNIVKSCELAGIRVLDIVLEQIASADAVLTPAEREMGVGIIDIGGGTSDFAIYKDGRIHYSKVLPIAGNHFTQDLAFACTISKENAELLKKQHGVTYNPHANATVSIDLDYDLGQKQVAVSFINNVLRSRAEEIFELFSDEIRDFKLRSFMPAGLVLTGGGSLLSGIQEIAQNKLDMAVRIGCPLIKTTAATKHVPDMLKSPIYATAYGLLLHATGQAATNQMTTTQEASFVRIFKRMKSWIYDFL